MSVVKVTQEDREAAESARAWCDDMDEPEMVQAFAQHRQSAIAELCEGLRAARAALEQLDEAASNFSVSGVYFEEPIFTRKCEALEKARAAVERAEALLSKHSPDAPGQHAGTRAIEPSDGDEA